MNIKTFCSVTLALLLAAFAIPSYASTPVNINISNLDMSTAATNSQRYQHLAYYYYYGPYRYQHHYWRYEPVFYYRGYYSPKRIYCRTYYEYSWFWGRYFPVRKCVGGGFYY